MPSSSVKHLASADNPFDSGDCIVVVVKTAAVSEDATAVRNLWIYDEGNGKRTVSYTHLTLPTKA